MPRRTFNITSWTTPLVVGLSFFGALILAVKTYYINFWPTDSVRYVYYASKLGHSPFVANVYKANPRTIILCGKETLLVVIALFQFLLHDRSTLFPNILPLILATAASGILIYFIVKKMLDASTGFLAFVLFSTSFWPFVYVLQGAHPPLALMFFLLSVVCLLALRQRSWPAFFAGLCAGLMLFASPSSVIYVPYLAGLVVFLWRSSPPGKKNAVTLPVLALLAAGGLAVFLAFTLPNPVDAVKYHLHYLSVSHHQNFFVLDRAADARHFTVPPGFRGAGWPWILSYMLVILPVFFPVYALSAAYLLDAARKAPAMLALVAVCALPPFLVELSGVPQFGRNYFPWMVGMIFSVCFAARHFYRTRWGSLRPAARTALGAAAVLLLLAHMAFSAVTFGTDIFPSRMATRDIYKWLRAHDIQTVYVHKDNPQNWNIAFNLVNFKYTAPLHIGFIDSIREVPAGGYILVSPVNEKTIYDNCAGNTYRFPRDPYLNALIRSGRINDYAVASFPTLSSSRIWPLEEEVCAYRDLILGQITDRDRRLGHAWILDAAKLQRDWPRLRRTLFRSIPAAPAPAPVKIYTLRPLMNEKQKALF